MKKILTTFMLLAFAVSSKAAIITSDTTEIVTTGQTFSTTVSITNNFSNIIIDLVAKGDFDNPNVEYFRLFLDGTQILDWNTSTPGISVIENIATLDYTLTGSVLIAQPLWDALTADGNLDISWVIGPFSNPSTNRGGLDFISYEIRESQLVSSPGVVSIFAFSLLIVASVSRRKSTVLL